MQGPFWRIEQQQPGRRGGLVWVPKQVRDQAECPTAEAAVQAYRAWLAERPWLPQDLPLRAKLRGQSAAEERSALDAVVERSIQRADWRDSRRVG